MSQSSLVTIRGKAGTPERAAEIANAFAAAIVAKRTELLQNDIDASIDRLEARLDEIAGDESSRRRGDGRSSRSSRRCGRSSGPRIRP